ncbi:hypothetical protein [Iningainema tapete]|uniref:Uncharacterized protein n=1 Tax=Iningainema tapete BLCC-T55 TaxID=2748662 RepID=A0A8J6XGT2_9CYAN|nr:hypothetical protein [Iningainema tapete]MBD2771559.1 hypothetical protein [Iningainema tapete BLCC-T55]
MNIEFYNRVPVQPLVLHSLSYIWLGWYLSAHDIVWWVGAIVVGSVFAVVSKSISWVEYLVNFGSRALVVVLFLCASIAVVATWSLLLTFILIPLLATVLAEIELRLASLNKPQALSVLIVLAGIGLGIGGVLDFLY